MLLGVRGEDPVSSYAFPAPDLESAIGPGRSGSVLWEMSGTHRKCSVTRCCPVTPGIWPWSVDRARKVHITENTAGVYSAVSHSDGRFPGFYLNTFIFFLLLFS